MDLVFQGEIKGEMGHFFLIKDLHPGFICLVLEIADHVREPDNKAIVTAAGWGDTSGHKILPKTHFTACKLVELQM